MAVTPVRVSGVVLSNTERTINRKSDGKEFTFRHAGVLVGNKGVTDIGFREDLADQMPGEGEIVDFLVSAEVYGGNLQFDFIEEYEEPSYGSRAATLKSAPASTA